jgi:hypothetical protein
VAIGSLPPPSRCGQVLRLIGKSLIFPVQIELDLERVYFREELD